jgi:RNA recognition motif-containing protein
MQSKLYVGNLSSNVSEDEIRGLFSQAGEIKEIVLITDRETQRRKGFGFVEMINQPDAEKAIRMFNDQELGGRRLTVSLAKPREDRRDNRSRSSY